MLGGYNIYNQSIEEKSKIMMYIDKKDLPKELLSLVRNSFGSYKNVFSFVNRTQDLKFMNYWDGGSTDEVICIEQATMKVVPMKRINPLAHRSYAFNLPKGYVLAVNKIRRGNSLGITFYSHECFVIEASDEPELSLSERIVLIATRSFKANYRLGEIYRLFDHYRRKLDAEDLAVMTSFNYDAVREQLVDKGYMTKRKSLNTNGKNLALTLGDFDDIFRSKYGSWL